ncbi:helix-turn-helix transcriptional regulator [Paenibacillus sp. S150]|uniref:ArsR/SmtB family transcription factor n=1 Tax=Paenibacillus sp. S150 TaxID=2749826 RepID=UPI001C582FAD|nr:metalloregulator ArsR/SmtB family transcription factor [Paenibacillus sp. S150]MBW4084930.1 winged helix-turn-helix transcriptional regulator [Paenibacillus sp. S150]
MEYTVEVDFAPMYECFTSLTAFLYKQNHNALESGKPWVKEVQKKFTSAQLQQMQKFSKENADFTLTPYIWSCPGERSVAGFLDWFDSLSAGELFEITARFGSTVPSNLAGLRSSASGILREWDERYFRGIDPAILEGLSREADSRRAELGGANTMGVYERATQGMRLYPGESLKQIILIPQYHARPLVTSSLYDEFVFTSYACDALPPEEGRPAPALLRLTRALSDETRLLILRLLAGKQLSFTEIVRQVGLSKSTIHYHLITLRSAGLVIVHSNGKSASYSLRLDALNDLPQRISDYLEK